MAFHQKPSPAVPVKPSPQTPVRIFYPNIFRSASTLILIGICFAALGGELWWDQASLSRQATHFAAEQARAAGDRDKQAHLEQQQLAREDAARRERLQNADLVSGAMARDRHQQEWARRLAHDPSLAQTLLETNMLIMQRVGRDPTLATQLALEQVARLASPTGSRVEVDPDANGFRVRVAYMMSRLSAQESGPTTKHHTVASMRSEVQELSARVLRDLYEYCGSRDLRSISVTCNHTVRQSMVPSNATAEEKAEILEHAEPVLVRLYRISLDESRARTIADWRQVSLPHVTDLATVEFDGFTNLTIVQDASLFQDKQDAAGELQF